MGIKAIIIKNRILFHTAFILFCFFLGFFSNYLLQSMQYTGNNDHQNDYKEVRQGGYKFINPLLECDTGEKLLTSEIRPFKKVVNDFVTAEDDKLGITQTSVYFRDLNNGPWFGINEKFEFSPASMLKVPLMMSVLKKAEGDTNLLKEKIKFNENGNYSSQVIKPRESIKAGQEYTIDELLARMIIFSDNFIQTALFQYIGDEATAKTYSDLGLSVPTEDHQENFMSVKNYASFFRVLYNSSYFNNDYSEKALQLLSRVDYKGGIRAGVPDSIPVAHKFGERIISDNEKQFHDCGIVYYPDHPYLLCIMNRSKNYEAMQEFITEISKLVFNEVDKQYKDK